MATMRDVANRAGVSKQTVSNVLNGRDRSPFVTPETRERILRAIEELDYHPDSNARGLRNGRTRRSSWRAWRWGARRRRCSCTTPPRAASQRRR